jgi:hypothetical protein
LSVAIHETTHQQMLLQIGPMPRANYWPTHK